VLVFSEELLVNVHEAHLEQVIIITVGLVGLLEAGEDLLGELVHYIAAAYIFEFVVD
jgi:hypothetical protein